MIGDVYRRIEKVGEGAYGVVYKCEDRRSGEIVALKVLKSLSVDSCEGISSSVLREISILKSVDHVNIVKLKDVSLTSRPYYYVFEYAESDLYRYLFVNGGLSCLPFLKSIAFQVICGLDYLHSHRIIHRDCKPSNILITKSGIVKICDFGMARVFDLPERQYTPRIGTMWYKAPELLMNDNYNPSVDIWSVGCILFEMFTGTQLFPGESAVDQMNKIFSVLGTPPAGIWTGYDPATFEKREPQNLYDLMPDSDPALVDLIMRMLVYDINKRITAKEALNHPFFQDISIDVRMKFTP